MDLLENRGCEEDNKTKSKKQTALNKNQIKPTVTNKHHLRVLFERTLQHTVLRVFVMLALFGLMIPVYTYTREHTRTQHAAAATGINHKINFQGKLVNPNGTNVTDGTYSIVFSIYNVASAGTAIWTETQSVTVTNGIFQVNLGSVTTLPGSIDFNTDNIYLGVKVGADAEMTPRIQFTAVPQAFNAEKLGGLDKTGFVQSQNSSAQAASFFIQATSGVTATIQGASGQNIMEIKNSGGTTVSSFTSTGDLKVAANIDTTTATTLGVGNSTATAVNICNSTACDTIQIGTNADADTIQVGDASDTITFTGGSGSTFVLNGQTVSSSEFLLLDGKDAALVDINDAVATAITGTGALTAGSINWSGAIATSGNISTSGTGTITSASTVTGTTLNGTTGINSGAGAGTQRIDSSGNLVNIGTIGAINNSNTTDVISLNKTFQQTSSSSTFYYKIATLPASTAATYDHLHLMATLNTGWGSTQNSYVEATFANRNSFKYQYSLKGAAVNAASTLAAYQTASGNIDIYIVLTTGAFTTASYSILENEQATVYADPFGSRTSTAPTGGSWVFDASVPATYPAATSIDNSSNLTVGGNLTVSGTGTSSFAGTLNLTAANALNVGGTTVLTSARVLQNVTADTSILTSGTLGVVRGGTGNTTYSTNGSIYYDGAKFVSTAAGSNGQCLLANTGAAPTWGTCTPSSLQGSYNASTGGTSPEIKLDSTRGALDIQDADTSINGSLLTVHASNGSGLGADLFDINSSGQTTFTNTTNSTTAFQVQNNSSATVFDIDTVNARLGVNTSNPQAVMDIQALSGTSTDTVLAVRALAPSSSIQSSTTINLYTSTGTTFTTGPQTAKLDESRVVTIFSDGDSSFNACASGTWHVCASLRVGTIGLNGITYGTRYTIYGSNSVTSGNTGIPNFFSVTPLGSNKVVARYYEDTSSTEKLIVCDISGTTVTGCGTAVASAANTVGSLAALSSTSFVESYNGGARVSTVSGTTITTGAASAQSLGTNTAVAALSSTSFVVAGSSGNARVATVSGTTITWGGSSYAWAASSVTDLTSAGITALSSTSIAIAGDGVVTVGSVSGTTLTFGSPYAIGTAAEIALTSSSSSGITAAYDTGSGVAAVNATISGTTLTFGTQVTVDSTCGANCKGVSIAPFSTNLLYVADTNTSSKVMNGIAIVMDNVLSVRTSLTTSNSANIYTSTGSNFTTGPQAAKLDESRVVTIYADVNNSFSACGSGSWRSCASLRVGTIGLNGITYGTSYTIYGSSAFGSAGSSTPSNFSVVPLGSNKIVARYYEETSSTDKLIVCDISGTTVTGCGTAVTAAANSVGSLTALSSTSFVESYNGGARVSTVSGTTITTGAAAAQSLGTNTAIAALNSTSFVVAGDSGNARVATVSGTTITWGGSSYAWAAGAVTDLTNAGIVALSNTSIAVGGGSTITVGTISGTTITFGSPYAIGVAAEIALTSPSSSNITAAYDTGSGVAAVNATVSGTTLLYGSQISVDSTCGANCLGVSITSLSTNLLYVADTNTSSKVMKGLAVILQSVSGATFSVSATGSVTTAGFVGINLTCASNKVVLGSTVTNGIVTAGTCSSSTYSDIAEQYASTQALEPGDIVAPDPASDKTHVVRSTTAYQSDVMGIVSTKPAQVLADDAIPDGYPIALAGRVPTKVNLEGGIIHKGDKITTSSVSGVGAKAIAAGIIIGTALEGYDGTGDAKIEVFVGTSYYNPIDGNNIQATDMTLTGNLQMDGSAFIGGDLNISGAATLSDLMVTGDVTIQGNLIVVGDMETSNIKINGHIITAGDLPVVTVGSGAGVGDAVHSIGAPVVSIVGNDTSGTITITAGANGLADVLANIDFAHDFGGKPRVVLSPANRDAVKLGVYYDESLATNSTIKIMADNAPQAGKTYVLTYFIVE